MDDEVKRTVLDLSPEAKITFGGALFRLERETGRPFDQCYLALLGAWELECFHPPHRRKWLKPGCFECTLCKMRVLNIGSEAEEDE